MLPMVLLDDVVPTNLLPDVFDTELLPAGQPFKFKPRRDTDLETTLQANCPGMSQTLVSPCARMLRAFLEADYMWLTSARSQDMSFFRAACRARLKVHKDTVLDAGSSDRFEADVRAFHTTLRKVACPLLASVHGAATAQVAQHPVFRGLTFRSESHRNECIASLAHSVGRQFDSYTTDLATALRFAKTGSDAPPTSNSLGAQLRRYGYDHLLARTFGVLVICRDFEEIPLHSWQGVSQHEFEVWLRGRCARIVFDSRDGASVRVSLQRANLDVVADEVASEVEASEGRLCVCVLQSDDNSDQDMPEVIVPSAAECTSTLKVVAVVAEQVVRRRVPRTDNAPRRVVFKGEGLGGREQQQMRSIVEDASGFTSLPTNGNGACGLHAAFGELEIGDNGVEFFCANGRLQAVAALRYGYENAARGVILRQKVLTAMWCELTKPNVMCLLGMGGTPTPHAQEFWSKLPRALRDRYVSHVRDVEAACTQNQELRGELSALSRELCRPETAEFLHTLFTMLEGKYSNIHKYDVDGKLDSMLDPHTENDKLRTAFFLPTHDAADYVAEQISILLSTHDNPHDEFRQLKYDMADLLQRIAAVPRIHNDESPQGFATEAFSYYLEALATEGHSYYLSPEELLATAEVVGANVIITQLEQNQYRVYGQHLGCDGEVAVLVLHWNRPRAFRTSL